MIKVLCLGDSLTTGYPEYSLQGKEEAVYSYWMKKFTDNWLKENNIDEEVVFINAGVPGDTLPRMGSRLMGYSDYNVLIIIGGGNDIANGRSTDSVLINFEQLINEVEDDTIVICGLMPPVSKEFEYNLYFRTYNKMLEDYLRDTDIHEIIDYKLGNADGYLKPEFNYGDGIHLNIEGYKKMAESIFPIFENKVLKALKK